MQELISLGGPGTARVAVAPWRGAKIISLRGPDGAEWLAQPADGLLDRAESGIPFTSAEMSGWDECAPTIDACVLPDGTALRDHGDLWDQAWEVRAGDGVMDCRARGRDWPYRFSRTVSVDGPVVRLDYEVVSEDSVARPFLWAAHPQFTAPVGTRVELGGASSMLRTTEDPPAEAVWRPADVDLPTGSCAKWWPPRPAVVQEASLVRPDGAALTMRVSGPDVPWIGVWSDAAAYARGRVVALEPATGWYADAARASAQDSVLVLEPGARSAWRVEVELTP